MFDPKPTKALFRCMFAYSDGQPVEVFDVQDTHLQWDETLMASANSAVTLKVAVAGDVSQPDSHSTEWAEMLATAYEMFVDDPEVANDYFQWVRLEGA
jgi:hypothetical protein